VVRKPSANSGKTISQQIGTENRALPASKMVYSLPGMKDPPPSGTSGHGNTPSMEDTREGQEVILLYVRTIAPFGKTGMRR